LIDVNLKDYMGTDLSVVNAARVSFGKETEEFNTSDANLIKFLAKHRHMSPFGHCFATFHVKAPIFVARQLVKHKFLRWNEISRRYVNDGISFYYPEVWRSKATDKKQGSGPALADQEIDLGTTHTVVAQLYNSLIDKGVCPEQARMVLPQNTMTEWWWSGSLDAWADMCNLRRKDDTQYETRLVANAISMDMKGLYPASWEALVSVTHNLKRNYPMTLSLEELVK